MNVIYNNLEKIKKVMDWLIYQFKLSKHRPRLIWNSLYIRKDEFHSSLDMDVMAMLDMNKKDRDKYINNLMIRRNIAHEKDIEI